MELALDPEIKKRLNKNEKVKYLATYNKDNFTPDIVLAEDTSGNTLAAYSYVNTDVYDKKRILITNNFIFNQYQIGNIPSQSTTLTETYILSTYNDIKTIMFGEIQWGANYISGDNTVIEFQEFMVNGNQGIYKSIIKVIIDFREPIRKVHLIEYNECNSK